MFHTLLDEVLLEGFCVYECPDGDDFCDAVMFLALQISWVMVPIGQYTHHERGLNKIMVTKPNTVEVSMTL